MDVQFIGGSGPNYTTRPVADIQRLVGADPTGVWDFDTTAKVEAWQNDRLLNVTGTWDLQSDGRGFPKNEILEGAVYSNIRRHPAQLNGLGIHHVGRYLSAENNLFKGLNSDEYELLEQQEISTWYIYENSDELFSGVYGGQNLANEAEIVRINAGLPKKPIYFSVDRLLELRQHGAVIEGLQGIIKVLGIDRVGLIAEYNLLKSAFDAGVIKWGAQVFGITDNRVEPRAHLHLYANEQFDGHLSFVRATALEFGQNVIANSLTPADVELIVRRILAEKSSATEVQVMPSGLSETEVRRIVNQMLNRKRQTQGSQRNVG